MLEFYVRIRKDGGEGRGGEEDDTFRFGSKGILKMIAGSVLRSVEIEAKHFFFKGGGKLNFEDEDARDHGWNMVMR